MNKKTKMTKMMSKEKRNVRKKGRPVTIEMTTTIVTM